MIYLSGMDDYDGKKALWGNVKTLMKARYGKENLSRLIADSKVGPGTVTRIKEQKTSVGIDVLGQIANALKVKPWQLLIPGFADDPADEAPALPVASPITRFKDRDPTLDAAVTRLAQHLESLGDYDRVTATSLLAALANSPHMHPEVASGLGKLTSKVRESPSKQA